VLVDEVACVEGTESKHHRLEQEGFELIRLQAAKLPPLRRKIRELGRIPSTKRNSLVAEELSLAVFQLCQVRFAMGVLADRLRWLQLQRKGEQVAPALRLAARTAPKSQQPATHIAARPN